MRSRGASLPGSRLSLSPRTVQYHRGRAIGALRHYADRDALLSAVAVTACPGCSLGATHRIPRRATLA